MKSSALLFEDHRHILRALKVLEEMSALVEHGHEPNEKDVQDILDFLGGFGDRVHQGREEGILFPALLLNHEQKNYRKLSSLIFEHNRQRSLIEGLQESLLAKDKKDFVYSANRLVEILRLHIRDEEETLLPLANSTLSSDQDERVEADMKKQDEVWQQQNIPLLLGRLDKLESKYVKTPPGPRGAVV